MTGPIKIALTGGPPGELDEAVRQAHKALPCSQYTLIPLLETPALDGSDGSLCALWDRYDAVFLLPPLERSVTDIWTGHPHLRVLEGDCFSGRIQRLTAELTALLGALEIERKYLVAYPDLEVLEQLPACRKVQITQTYLTAPDGDEHRVRSRGAAGGIRYYETVKRTLSPEKRVERERCISEAEYQALLLRADPAHRPIRKTRYCFIHLGQYLELDLYPFWSRQAILEVELWCEDAAVQLPKWLTLIREVTGDPAFKNAALARRTDEPDA